MQLSNMHQVSELLSDLSEEVKQDNDAHPIYPRVCHYWEQVADLLAEAKDHGCVLAFKGEATVIMPKLIEGWSLSPVYYGEDELERLRRLV
jgi:hypothetical protein